MVGLGRKLWVSQFGPGLRLRGKRNQHYLELPHPGVLTISEWTCFYQLCRGGAAGWGCGVGWWLCRSCWASHTSLVSPWEDSWCW